MVNNSERLFKALKVVFWILAGILAVVFIYGQTIGRVPGRIHGVCKELTGTWTYVAPDGTETEFTLPCELDIPNGEPVYQYTTLPDDIADDMYLMQFTGRNTLLKIDDEVRFSLYQDDNPYPGRIVKGSYYLTELSSADCGKILSIERDETRVYTGNTNTIYYGDMLGLMAKVIEINGVTTILAIGLLCISILLIGFGIILRRVYGRKMSILYLGYSMLSIAAWLIFDSNLFQFIFDSIYSDGVLSFLACMIMPFPFMRYLNEIQNRRYEHIYSIIGLVQAIVYVVTVFLHVTDIYSFMETMPYIDVIIGLAVLAMFYSVGKDIVSKSAGQYILIIIGFVIFGVFGIAELVLINIVDQRLGGFFAEIGLYIVVIMAVIHAVQEIVRVDRERADALNASMMKTNFLANMSHELRTPINSISGMNEMILRETTDPTIKEYAGYIQRSGKILLSLINDVLDFSKIEAGKMDISCDPYKTSTLFVDLVELLEERAEQKSLNVHIDVDKTIPSVLDGDEVHIRQVVMNLLSNAVKYTPTGRVSLTISWQPCGNDRKCKLVFTVSDTGIGIRQGDIDRIFNVFERIDERRNRNIQGTGLGLAISKRLVDEMDGELTVSSIYGKGTTFMVTIPQLVVTGAPIGEDWRKKIKSASAGEEYRVSFTAPEARVLAVDDNASNLMIIKQFLKTTGVKLDLVGSGNEALKCMRDTKYDVILLDHMMPEPDGVEVLHRVRKDTTSVNQHTPIIVLTANAIVGSKEEYIKEGFDGYLSKPVDSELLEKIVAKHIDDSKKIRGDEATGAMPVKAVAFDKIDDSVKSDNSIPVKTAETETETVDKTSECRFADCPGMEYSKLLRTMNGDTELADEIIMTAAKEVGAIAGRLHKELEDNDMKKYAVDAHSVKGIMANIYYEELRAHAKEHEFAAKEGRTDYINGDIDKFIAELNEFCRMVQNS